MYAWNVWLSNCRMQKLHPGVHGKDTKHRHCHFKKFQYLSYRNRISVQIRPDYDCSLLRCPKISSTARSTPPLSIQHWSTVLQHCPVETEEIKWSEGIVDFSISPKYLCFLDCRPNRICSGHLGICFQILITCLTFTLLPTALIGNRTWWSIKRKSEGKSGKFSMEMMTVVMSQNHCREKQCPSLVFLELEQTRSSGKCTCRASDGEGWWEVGTDRPSSEWFKAKKEFLAELKMAEKTSQSCSLFSPKSNHFALWIFAQSIQSILTSGYRFEPEYITRSEEKWL